VSINMLTTSPAVVSGSGGETTFGRRGCSASSQEKGGLVPTTILAAMAVAVGVEHSQSERPSEAERDLWFKLAMHASYDVSLKTNIRGMA
jgi:hypothetical protein